MLLRLRMLTAVYQHLAVTVHCDYSAAPPNRVPDYRIEIIARAGVKPARGFVRFRLIASAATPRDKKRQDTTL